MLTLSKHTRRATAYAFAKKNPKAIYVTDLAENNLADLAKDITEKTGVDCIPKRVDASSDEDIKSVIADAMEKYGRLDVFFANAGIATFHSMVEETKEAFLHIMQVNSWRYVYRSCVLRNTTLIDTYT